VPEGYVGPLPQGNKPGKAGTVAFRNDLLLFLRDAGFSSAAKPAEPPGLTVMQQVARETGVIDGLPWTLSAHRQQNLDLSGAQDAVRARAEAEHSELWATIHHRKNHSLDQAYVVMPVVVFARVLAGLRPSTT